MIGHSRTEAFWRDLVSNLVQFRLRSPSRAREWLGEVSQHMVWGKNQSSLFNRFFRDTETTHIIQPNIRNHFGSRVRSQLSNANSNRNR